MILSTCLLAGALLQGAPPPASTSMKAEPELPKTYANLDTMRRLLARTVAQKSMAAAPKSAAAGGSDTETGSADPNGDNVPGSPGGGRPGNVTYDFLRSSGGFGGAEQNVASHAEYVPGLAAVFSLTVPVPTELRELKDGEPPQKPAVRNDDDAAWDAIASGEESRAWRTYNDLVAGGKERSATHEQVYSAAALAAVRSAVIDTMWRFGHKLELGRGERLAVVVTIQPSSDLRLRWLNTFQDPNLLGRGGGGVSGSPADPKANVWFTTPASQRVVFQVSAEDLKAYKSGDLDPEDLAKKTRVQCFAMPADESPGPGSVMGSRQAR